MGRELWADILKDSEIVFYIKYQKSVRSMFWKYALHEMKYYELTWTQFADKPLDMVFPYFSNPKNLEEITPPTLCFTILTPSPIVMDRGSLIDYYIRILNRLMNFIWIKRDLENIFAYRRDIIENEFQEEDYPKSDSKIQQKEVA